MLVAPGNPNRLADLPSDLRDPIIEKWAHWQSADWHSIVIEQGVGLLYGLGLAVAMAMLATRLKPVQTIPTGKRWTQVFSVAFLMTVLLYLSMIKNVTEWTGERAGGFRMVAGSMKMPLIKSIYFSRRTWFQLAFLFLSLCVITLLIMHTRRKLAIVPATWLGKGEAALPHPAVGHHHFQLRKSIGGFTESRLATEGVLFVNAVIATFMINTCTTGGPCPAPGIVPRLPSAVQTESHRHDRSQHVRDFRFYGHRPDCLRPPFCRACGKSAAFSSGGRLACAAPVMRDVEHR